MDQKALIKLLLILQKNGVTYYKDKDIELNLVPSSSASRKNDEVSNTYVDPSANPQAFINSMIPKEDGMDEDKFLYWSSGYNPEDNKLVEPDQSK